MENRKLQYDIKNIDMDNIDTDLLGESLLRCAVKTKKFCKLIDKQVHDIACTAHRPYVTAMEQYDEIVEKMIIKSELMRLYQILAKWYSELSYKQSCIFKAYFIKENKTLCRQMITNGYYRSGVIKPMSRSFLQFVKHHLKLDATELLNNPIICNVYNVTLRKNKKFQTEDVTE